MREIEKQSALLEELVHVLSGTRKHVGNLVPPDGIQLLLRVEAAT